MKVIYGIGQAKGKFSSSILVIGIFDGLHIGHQKLIQRAVARARELKMPSVVLTFSPHPMRVLHPEHTFKKIVSLSYRLKLLEQLGVDTVVIAKFSSRFSKMLPDYFARHYLRNIFCVKEVFVGDDFRFGQARQGTIMTFGDLARKYHFQLRIVPQVHNRFEKISSTLIRQRIIEGDFIGSEKLLGRRFAIMGEVERGDDRGQKLGFPTINIYPEHLQILPPLGVYAVYVMIGKKRYKGVANVGHRVMFQTKRPGINVEVNIFNFRRDIYDQMVVVEFVKFIRSEKKFQSVEKLVEQMKRDQNKSKEILNSILHSM